MVRNAPVLDHDAPMTVDEAAAFLGISTWKLRKKAQAREIPQYRPNGPRRRPMMFFRSDLLAWRKAQTVPVSSP